MVIICIFWGYNVNFLYKPINLIYLSTSYRLWQNDRLIFSTSNCCLLWLRNPSLADERDGCVTSCSLISAGLRLTACFWGWCQSPRIWLGLDRGNRELWGLSSSSESWVRSTSTGPSSGPASCVVFTLSSSLGTSPAKSYIYKNGISKIILGIGSAGIISVIF